MIPTFAMQRKHQWFKCYDDVTLPTTLIPHTKYKYVRKSLQNLLLVSVSQQMGGIETGACNHTFSRPHLNWVQMSQYSKHNQLQNRIGQQQPVDTHFAMEECKTELEELSHLQQSGQ